MLEIADKDDVKRLENEIIDLRTQVNNLKNEIKQLMETHDALEKFINSLGGKHTY